MAKWNCPCGNRMQSSGPVPNPQEWRIVSDHDLDKIATAAELNDSSRVRQSAIVDAAGTAVPAC